MDAPQRQGDQQPTAEELRLVDLACSGAASASEIAQLEQLMRHKPSVRKCYLDFAAMHADLYGAVRLERTRELITSEICGAPTVVRHRSAGWQRGLAAVAMLATAAAVLVAFYALQLQVGDGQLANQIAENSDSNTAINVTASGTDDVDGEMLSGLRYPQVAATIEQLEDVTLSDGAPALAKGMYLTAEQDVAIESGRIKIAFRQGAVAVLEGPGRLVVHSEKYATLHQGDLAVVAPAWAVGFRVDTPRLNVIDHGTKFVVSVDDNADEPNVKVAVADGEVEVFESNNLLTSHRLLTGDGVSSNGQQLTLGPATDTDTQLANELPSLLKRGEAVVVGDRWEDWTAGTIDQPRRVGPWRYFANVDGDFGDVDSYVELLWNPHGYFCPQGSTAAQSPPPLEFVKVHRDGGHPGRGRFQELSDRDHYSITAFIVPEDGHYLIEAGWIERPEAKVWVESHQLDVAIHVNREAPVMHRVLNQAFMKFATDLGERQAGDVVYVGVGPSGWAYNDRFRWGFYVVRELTPEERQ